MSRIVYGAFIARNAKEYLLGRDEAPEYYFNTPLTQRAQKKDDGNNPLLGGQMVGESRSLDPHI
jgi:hypothetical protein